MSHCFVIVVLGGLAHSLIDRAPFITEPMRSYALYIVYAIVAIALVVKVLIPLIHILVAHVSSG